MTIKKIVKDFYKSDALINPEVMDTFLHPDVLVDWNSGNDFIQMNRDGLLAMTAQLSKSYIRSKARISHLLKEGDNVTVRYSHYIKTIENPREEMLIAHVFVIWEIRDNKLFRGYKMSQFS